MRELEIKLTGVGSGGETLVHVDDTPVSFKKNQFGNYVCTYRTENDRVNIKILKLLDVGGIGWFFTQIFFFIISIFGLFDIYRREKCYAIDFETNIYLKEENKISLKLETPKGNGKAVTVDTDLINEETANTYYTDKKARKTIKILRLTKIFLALAIIVSAIVVLIVKL